MDLQLNQPHELVFIDFYAPWCIWCQRLEPVLAKLGQELGQKGPIYVGRIDCTHRENEQACVSQHVHSFPSMYFYRHGDEHPFEAYHGERTVEVCVFAFVASMTGVAGSLVRGCALALRKH